MIEKKIYLRFLTTYVCNYSCSFCFREGVFHNERIEELPVATFSTILKATSNIGLKKIKLVGGDPLQCDNLFAYLNECFKMDCPDIGISTNGYDYHLIKKLAISFPKLKFTLSIPSIDTNEYKKITGVDGLTHAMKSLEILNGMNILSTVNYVITSINQITNLLNTLEEFFLNCNRVKLLVFCKTDYNSIDESIDFIEKELVNFLDAHYKMLREDCNNIYYTYSKDKELCITKPYCPILCKEMHEEVQTIRITPDGQIKPCLIDNSHNLSFKNDVTVNEITNHIEYLSRNPLQCDK